MRSRARPGHRRPTLPAWILLLAMAAAMPASAVPLLDPEVEEGNASCGGVAPHTQSCTARTTLVPGGFNYGISVSVGYSGSVTNRGTTATGTYTYHCSWLAAPFGQDCWESTTGDFLVGQTITIAGSATGAGVWEVSIYN